MCFPPTHNQVKNMIGEIVVSGTMSVQCFDCLNCGLFWIRSKHFDIVQQYSYNSLARVTIVAVLSYLIYINLLGILINFSVQERCSTNQRIARRVPCGHVQVAYMNDKQASYGYQ